MPDRPPQISQTRCGFSHRLRALRTRLGYSQTEMSYALGIQPARYNKYEIGRSQAPYEILMRLAKLAKIDVHYLITGEHFRTPATGQMLPEKFIELIDWLPTPAAVFDRTKKLVAHNRLYVETLFRDCPSLIRPGTSLEFLARAWANARGLGPDEAEEFVQARLIFDSAHDSAIQLMAGGTRLHIAKTHYQDYKLVLITVITERRKQSC